MTTDLKLKLYPALIGVLTTIIAVLLLGRLISPAGKPASRFSPLGSVEADRPLAVSGLSAIATVPWTESLVETEPVATPVLPAPALPAIAAQIGQLRVSNSTPHVVRVVLLAQKPDSDSNTDRYREAVHWDFAPGEGAGKGLLLSLPDGELQLQPNDVLMGFSLDGSQRYWGPYVVGQTPFPSWNDSTGEWTLDLVPKAP